MALINNIRIKKKEANQMRKMMKLYISLSIFSYFGSILNCVVISFMFLSTDELIFDNIVKDIDVWFIFF